MYRKNLFMNDHRDADRFSGLAINGKNTTSIHSAFNNKVSASMFNFVNSFAF
jgi:hypothetical protein